MHQDTTHSVGFRPTFEALLQNARGLSRLAVVDESVVSCRIRIGPSVAATRSRVAWKCPDNIGPSLTLRFKRQRYAALVLIQSWQASGIDCPSRVSSCRTNF